MDKLISLIDLTSLHESNTPITIAALCKQAQTPHGPVAAVCIYPPFVQEAKRLLQNTTIKIATVANFPGGDQAWQTCLQDIKKAISHGVDEIDVVMPYKNFLAGDYAYVFHFLRACREVSYNKTLKVILETGALKNSQQIKSASEIVIEVQANFIKTSTGKIKIGATLEAVSTILNTIKLKHAEKNVGIKVAGGIRTPEQAVSYLTVIEKIMGMGWIDANHVRFGASQLLDALI